MARITVLSYPVLDVAGLDWIESIRAQQDPQASRIPPHFTLVFPVDAPAYIAGEAAANARRDRERYARRHHRHKDRITRSIPTRDALDAAVLIADRLGIAGVMPVPVPRASTRARHHKHGRIDVAAGAARR